ncbi:GIY-YIG nuclease family protein [Flavihumibacter sp. R14]|nr:GIY-YIG nuclease family protein [Flavihumibacter soli]
MFYLYILHSASSEKYYIGYTEDAEKRLFEHNHSERNTYTSKHRPWVLKKCIALGESRGVAMKIEKVVKKTKSRLVIERIITEVSTVEELAQLVRVPTRRD